ncbi:MAG: porin [Acetobacteraceae bacterium]|nr:porin [Acetobacteraceae bacterium]
MRKLLLASAATIGAAGFTAAHAQPATPMPATTMPVTESQGMIATQPAASPPAGANNNNNTTAAATPGPVANPTPGSVVVHINGRVFTGLYASWGSLDSVHGVAGGTAAGAQFKINPLHVATYARLYTGVDGMATNGLRYGGAIEIRENFTGQTSNSGSSAASGYTSSETLFVRRAFAYVASDTAGILRAGQGDGLISLYDNGVTTFQFLPSGNLNGGDVEVMTPGNTQIPFAFVAVAGNEYGTNRLVYMSPQFYGFDAGVQWAPSTTNGYAVQSPTFFTVVPGCPTAAPGCDTLSSSTNALDGSRSINQTAVGLRYQGKFGDIGLLAYGVYEFSGHAKYDGPFIPAGSVAALATSGGTGRFDNLSAKNAGVAVTFAGITVGGNYMGGAVNGQLALKPTGGANMNAYLLGAKYVTGPLTVGIVGERIFSQGAPQLVGITQRQEYGFDGGASYLLAPGLVGWAEYTYQHRYQGGFNFATGTAAPAAVAGAYNNVQSQIFAVGATVYW